MFGGECEWNVERCEIDVQGESVPGHVWSEVKLIYRVSQYWVMCGAK